MAKTVPFARPAPDLSHVKVGAPVSSSYDWIPYAGLGNFLLAKGAVLVPDTRIARTVTGSATDTYRFRVKTRASGLQRIWMLLLRATTYAATTVDIRAPAGSGTIVSDVSTTQARYFISPVIYTETVGSPAASEQEISISVTANGQPCIVESIGCYEQDNPLAGSAGIDIERVFVRQPIRSTSYGVITPLASGTADARRVGIYHVTTNSSNLFTKSTTGYQALLDLAVPVLAHKDLIADVTRSVKWSAYCRVTGGTGHVRLTTSNSGVSDVLNVTNTSLAWSTARSISIDCDDMDSDDGRQTAASPDWDGLQVEIEGPGGADSIEVESVSVWSE